MAKSQARERETGRYGFDGDWGRKCKCGHELGVHTAEAPHECMNNDRRHMADGPWFDHSIEPAPCDCTRFRPVRSAPHPRSEDQS
jgi:hypothetical protein